MKNSEDYYKFTKAELIRLIEQLKEQINYFEECQENYEEQLEHLKTENERYNRSIYEYEQKEKEEHLFNEFRQMRPLWFRKN